LQLGGQEGGPDRRKKNKKGARARRLALCGGNILFSEKVDRLKGGVSAPKKKDSVAQNGKKKAMPVNKTQGEGGAVK